jgi:integrase
MRDVQTDAQGRNVLEFDMGVRVYPPSRPGGYWRLRWEERRRAKDTTARDQASAIVKANEIVARLARSAPTELGKARGADLVAHYLDPKRRPPRVASWSIRHRDEQARICERFVLPVIAEVPCRELTRDDFQEIIDLASTKSVAQHTRRCLTAMLGAGIDEGHILAGRNLLRGVRWSGELDEEPEPVDHAVTLEEIPTAAKVHALARVTAERTGVWWRELQLLLVAYSGLRWGEHAALTCEQVDPNRRRIRVDRQVIEGGSGLVETLPKGRRRRTTMFPEQTPAGVDLATMVERRLDELEPGGLMFPSQRGMRLRRSNYGRSIWDPAAGKVDWPRTEDGRWFWTFHSLRHVLATWALHDARIPIEDLSRMMGHSSTRVTQDIYIHVRDDMFDRFFQATGQRQRRETRDGHTAPRGASDDHPEPSPSGAHGGRGAAPTGNRTR